MQPGLELKFFRLEHGVLQWHLASALLVSPQYVSMLESGRKPLPEGFDERYRAAVVELSASARSRRNAASSATPSRLRTQMEPNDDR
jgi:hypothetical protein